MKRAMIALVMLAAAAGAMDIRAAGSLPTGTEIIELRAPGARQFSNGDGTIRAEIGGWEPDSPDSPDTLVAVVAGFTDLWKVTGVIWYASGLTEMKLWHFVALWYEVYSNAWAEWTTASIPNGATINRVAVRLFSVDHEGFTQFPSLRIHEMVQRPSVLGRSANSDTAQILYDDCADGPVYAVVPPPGDTVWHEYSLNDEARRTLQARLPQNWFAIGMTGGEFNDVFAWSAYEGTEETPRQLWPRLVVDYTPPSGLVEGRHVPRGAGWLNISPNPLTSGFATLRFEGLGHNPKSQKDLGYVPSLTVNVYDVSGRSVFATRSPGHLTTGSLSLDLRSLSAGIYLVQVEAGDFTASQKLVVQK